MAYELGQDEARLTEVFNSFPAIYRKSKRVSEAGQHYYALQARYAQREGGDTRDPEEVSYIEPLSTEKLSLLLDFVLKMAGHEKIDIRTRITGIVAILAAILSAATAVFVALN